MAIHKLATYKDSTLDLQIQQLVITINQLIARVDELEAELDAHITPP